MAHNFVPEPPSLPSDNPKELSLDDTKEPEPTSNLNKICYCGVPLSPFQDERHGDWICYSCYRLFSKQTPSYVCPLAQYGQCFHTKMFATCFVACPDCYKSEIKENNNDNELVIHKKLKHHLDIIS